ncbi:hypothetical protein BHE74_00006887 [Ensete ventricosum]|uniref:TFIIB-type domain-containing protein n=1 Tax=Ensete ventricosum TaxID=4639 RepID=A0A444E8P5_ENSVE|nr:hypothetical protein B296_00006894 [Ensete ventricosum]RWW06733.1 hypothetical protein GW17_00029921 [Ensete ventricosum]RWW84495.1 hypothetical protein BHE74_00006887 [Ensete ventricosum]RZR75877.1 hypothetical protein BHM03_00000459 [Ensete ventricosum]
MGDAYCPDCKRGTEVVFDHSAGDTVCSECGLVLESHSVDETSEWRTFANESGDNDPVRVGGPTNPLLADGGLSTVISKPNGAQGDFLSSSLGRWQNRGSNPDRTLILAFKTIATMADRFPFFRCRFSLPTTMLIFLGKRSRFPLGLVATIKDRANEIYKKVEDLKSVRGRNQDAILAACLYIACRQEDKPRTVKDISLATGVAEGTIKNSYKDLYPYASRIIPTFFAKEEDLKNLCSP